MGLMDKVKDAFDGDKDNDMVNKAKEQINAHEAQVDAGVDRAGDYVDDKTGGKYADQVDKGQDYIKDRTGNL